MKSISFLGFRRGIGTARRGAVRRGAARRGPRAPDVTLRATISEAITDVCYRGTLAIVYDPDPDPDPDPAISARTGAFCAAED